MKKFILVVEDDSRNRKLIRDLLDVKGYEVAEAANGKDALAMVDVRLPDLILMDIQMPIMDGYEAAQMLKGSARTRAIPVWALTSYAMPGDEKKIRDIGCDAYITKPIDTRAFLLRVEKHFAAV
ncbi:MAG: response regulator [Lentisphaerae bacterium]|nr:response regulator [Lentisphaerota bacterium]